MTLVGRETDRLTHVLVNEPFETLREFWFPNQPGGLLTDRNGNSHDPTHAQVGLADVPFVPVRNLFARDIARPCGTFQGLVDSSCHQIRHHAGERVRLEIDASRRSIRVNGTSADLPAREFLLLLFLSQWTKSGGPAFSVVTDLVVALETFRKESIDAAPPDDWSHWRHHPTLEIDFSDEETMRLVANLRTRFRQLEGEASLLASCLPEPGRLRLDMPGSLIFIHDHRRYPN
jgi:hypothetical protein